MVPPDIPRLLARCRFLDGVPDEARARLAAIARPMRYAEGAMLFRRGDPGEGMVLVTDGVVRLSLVSAAGKELTLGLIGAGEPVGEIALVDGGPRSADASALTPVAALMLRHTEADTIIAAHPAMARALLRTLAARLRRTTDQVESVGLQPLAQRVAGALLKLASADASGLVRLPQGQIATLVAASRPKVNGVLADFRTRGLVAPARAGLRIVDAAALGRVAVEEGG